MRRQCAEAPHTKRKIARKSPILEQHNIFLDPASGARAPVIESGDEAAEQEPVLHCPLTVEPVSYAVTRPETLKLRGTNIIADRASLILTAQVSMIKYAGVPFACLTIFLSLHRLS